MSVDISIAKIYAIWHNILVKFQKIYEEKQMKKILFLALCLLFIIGLSSCGKDKSNEQKAVNEAKSLTLVTCGKTEYELVYPRDATGADLKFMKDIYNVFTNDMSVEINRVDDSLKSDEVREETYKILVGRTNYKLSDTAYDDLKYYDFRIVTDDTCLAIAAHTADGYAAAMKWLDENVFIKFSNGELMMDSADEKHSLSTDYVIESWTIGDNELKDYRIVYAEGIERDSVLSLRNEIAEKTGWFLDIVSDKSAQPSEYEILVGDTNRSESIAVEVPALNYVIKTVNEKLVIKTGGAHSFELLMENFDDIVIHKATKLEMGEDFEIEGDYFDNPNNMSKASGTNIRIMDANVLAQLKGYNDSMETGFAFDRRLEIFFAALDFYKPTIVGLQEFCMSWYNGIDKYDDIDKWEVLKFQNPQMTNEYVLSTIMYRKDLLTLLDSGMTYYSAANNGRCRCITWAVLKDNKTGKEFCFISTHWDGGNGDINGETANTLAQVDELSAFVNRMAEKYPVFTTGDFNRNEYTNAFKSYLSKINSVDAMYAANKRVNIAGSWHDWGKKTPSAGSCDHITATKNVSVLKFETAMCNQQIYASDHAWLVADIKFN